MRAAYTYHGTIERGLLSLSLSLSFVGVFAAAKYGTQFNFQRLHMSREGRRTGWISELSSDPLELALALFCLQHQG